MGYTVKKPKAGSLVPVVKTHIPCSASIVGTHIGLECNKTCSECGEQGHFRGKCPVAWGKAGHQLPGWTSSGKKISALWNGDVPKKATYKSWVKFIEDNNNFPRGAVAAKIPESPKLEDFKEQADKARS